LDFIYCPASSNDGNYEKLYKPAGTGLIKIENYMTGELVGIDYYKETDETVNEIIDKLLRTNVDLV